MTNDEQQEREPYWWIKREHPPEERAKKREAMKAFHRKTRLGTIMGNKRAAAAKAARKAR